MHKKYLISCICVTRNNVLLLERSIDCFLKQTYNYKELVVLIEDNDYVTIEFMKKFVNIESIKTLIVKKDENIKLGSLRNKAIRHASGEYICQWDDDDWYHDQRLEVQLNLLTKFKKEGIILGRWLIVNSISKKVYISHNRLWEGSILCKKDLLLDKYENLSQGEDTTVIKSLYDNNYLLIDVEHPYLYIYNYHGKNTCSEEHWKQIFYNSILLKSSIQREVLKLLHIR